MTSDARSPAFMALCLLFGWAFLPERSLGDTGAGPAAAPQTAAGPAIAAADPTPDALAPEYRGFPGLEFSAQNDSSVVTDISKGSKQSYVDCATTCDAQESCTGFSWYGELPQDGWPGGYSCFTKGIMSPCSLPDAGEARDDARWLFVKQIGCPADSPAALAVPAVAAGAPAPAVASGASAPAAAAAETTTALAPSYLGFTGAELNAARAANESVVEDLAPGGLSVATEQECAADCDARALCDAFSWYGTQGLGPGGSNCWPKDIGAVCSLPPEAEVFTDSRVLYVKQQGCPPISTVQEAFQLSRSARGVPSQAPGVLLVLVAALWL